MWHVAWRCRMPSPFNLHLNLKHCYKRGPCTSTPADIVYVHSEWGQVTVTLQEDTTNFVLMQFCLFLLLVLQLSPSVLFHLSEIFCTEASRYRRDPCFSFFFFCWEGQIFITEVEMKSGSMLVLCQGAHELSFWSLSSIFNTTLCIIIQRCGRERIYIFFLSDRYPLIILCCLNAIKS